MKICKHCKLDEEQVHLDMELGGIGCAHDLIEVLRDEEEISRLNAEIKKKDELILFYANKYLEVKTEQDKLLRHARTVYGGPDFSGRPDIDTVYKALDVIPLLRADLDDIATAVYPNKTGKFTYNAQFMVREILQMHYRLSDLAYRVGAIAGKLQSVVKDAI
jgi:hypothetical protein